MNKSILSLIVLLSTASILPMNNLINKSTHKAHSLIQTSQKRDLVVEAGSLALGINMATYIKNKSNQSKSLAHLGYTDQNSNSIKFAHKSMKLLGTSCIALPVGLVSIAMTSHDPSILYPIINSFLLTTHIATGIAALPIAALGLKEAIHETKDLKEYIAQEALARKERDRENKKTN